MRVAAPVREHVVVSIRQLIATSDYRPGERITERELCELTGASRSSVREALRHLEAEGLIEVIPHRGPVVANISPADAESIYQVRVVLEGLAGRLFTERRTPEKVAALKSCLAAIGETLKHEDSRATLRAKDAFYECLLTGAGNRAVIDTLKSLHGRIGVLRAASMSAPGRARRAYDELLLVVEAIEAGDALRAEQLCSDHARQAGRIAIDRLFGRSASK